MTADEAIRAAREAGLDGICLTEHDRAWQQSDTRFLAEKHGLPVFRGVEVMLQGAIEVLVFGLNIDFTTLLRLGELREMVNEAGGFIIYAHPFRGLREQTVSDPAAAMEVVLGRADIACIDAVEGRNGHNEEAHNHRALEMAARYNLKTTGGSDAHSVAEIGACVTVFERRVATDAELLNELKAGRFTSAAFRQRERWLWREDTRTIERRWL